MAVTQRPRGKTARLRPGPSGMPRGQVTEIQRGRMLAAAIDAVEEVGYAGMTVAQVITRARVSRKTFYDVFTDREDCFLAAFDQALEQAGSLVREAYRAEDSWREGVRAGLAQMLALMDDEPALTKLCVVEALAAGDRVLERRAEVMEQLAGVVDEGRTAPGANHDPPEVTAEGVVGALFQVLHSRVLEASEEPLFELLGPLMSMIVLPYMGTRAAGREVGRTSTRPERRRTSRTRSHGDPLEGLKMRLTYRTVRVLMVVAERPGASNRAIAEHSGIADQGQISKLLGRLARLELVENKGDGQEKGAANAWYLTARGAAVERATRPR
jgi:AcrR family transcriptional regulator/DNA-binding MarR family transcriptional regulator